MTKDERNERIEELYVLGTSTRKLGVKFSLSACHINVILRKRGVATWNKFPDRFKITFNDNETRTLCGRY